MIANYTLVEVEEVDREKYILFVFDAKPVREPIEVSGKFRDVRRLAEEAHFYCNTSVLLKNEFGDIVGILDRADCFIETATPLDLADYETIFQVTTENG